MSEIYRKRTKEDITGRSQRRDGKEVKVRQKDTFTYVDTTGADLSKIKSKTRKDKNIKAPLKKGEKVGETVYYLDRKKIGARDIVTTEKVEKQNYGSALENVLEEYFGI